MLAAMASPRRWNARPEASQSAAPTASRRPSWPAQQPTPRRSIVHALRALMPFAAILARRGASDRYRIGALRNLCEPKTLSVLIGGRDHLTSAHHDLAAMLCPKCLGVAIYVDAR